MTERIVILAQDLGHRINVVMAIQRFERYDEFPRDLHLREHILAMRMFDTKYHQIWDDKPRWMNYTL